MTNQLLAQRSARNLYKSERPFLASVLRAVPANGLYWLYRASRASRFFVGRLVNPIVGVSEPWSDPERLDVGTEHTQILSNASNSDPWRKRFRQLNPLTVAAAVLLISALYFFGIGRNRYQVTSSFIVRLPQIPSTTASSLLGTTLAGPTMLGSLEDGRFLSVYLTSPEVMKRVFSRLNPAESYQKKGIDLYAGLSKNANFDERLAFFRRQVFVVPQDLTGVINMTTIGLNPSTTYKLNSLLLQEAEDFLNKSNQKISQTQQSFAEQEVVIAKKRLDESSAKLSEFKNNYGNVNVTQEAAASSGYISQLESQLATLKVQEAALKRQFMDHSTPEVAYITDQVNELSQQIREEKNSLVSADGKNLNSLMSLENSLENEVAFATTALNTVMAFASDRRRETQQQIKFLVRLSDAELPAMQNYDWRFKGFLAVIGTILVVWGATSFALGIASRK